MPEKPAPVFVQQEEIVLTGVMAVYKDQDEASAKIPEQWRAFLSLPADDIQNATVVYGASPCTGDHQIHYLCGVAAAVDAPGANLQQIVLPAGEYATFTVNEDGRRGEVWGWILSEWLPGSGYREVSNPEYERFPREHGASMPGTPIVLGVPVERHRANQS